MSSVTQTSLLGRHATQCGNYAEELHFTSGSMEGSEVMQIRSILIGSDQELDGGTRSIPSPCRNPPWRSWCAFRERQLLITPPDHLPGVGDPVKSSSAPFNNALSSAL